MASSLPAAEEILDGTRMGFAAWIAMLSAFDSYMCYTWQIKACTYPVQRPELEFLLGPPILMYHEFLVLVCLCLLLIALLGCCNLAKLPWTRRILRLLALAVSWRVSTNSRVRAEDKQYVEYHYPLDEFWLVCCHGMTYAMVASALAGVITGFDASMLDKAVGVKRD
eukprot:gnl/TRDRNA2_/TRDRNA2_36454_c0_seq2.p1 gnl/TRDRNA2_/TRDRNA2_36454_c0~~gnl/TRDRNA2_/TRDRNA2_36454_c0_seq2.p1  ORF type:complete len:167 (-),score=27.13 gnl/TRDRNA2_/TRDRNA2_36454_c0_seq2:179-679(-)